MNSQFWLLVKSWSLSQPTSTYTLFNAYSFHTVAISDNISYSSISSNLYTLSTYDVAEMDTHAYVSVYVQWIAHAVAPLLSSRMVWYNLSQTVIRVSLIIATAINAQTNSTYTFSYIHVYIQFFPSVSKALWGYVICINCSCYPLEPHFITYCLLNIWYNFPFRWMLYLCMYSIGWITPLTSSCSLRVVFSKTILFSYIQYYCC